ncbi:MAG: sulfotransferase [Prochloraceae cyanobacterium]
MNNTIFDNLYQDFTKKAIRLNDYINYYLSELFAREDPFKTVEKYCMFVGYPRSGHSLVGSLLDAHPNIIVAHELNALRYFERGFSKRKIYYLLLRGSQRHAAAGRRETKYSYEVPNQWQGKFKSIKVIGDKKGSGTNQVLRENPDILNVLKDKIDVPIKFIHVTRNPYDNISTMISKRNRKMAATIDSYFLKCQTITKLKTQIAPEDFFEFKHESLIENPREILHKLCVFLDVEPHQNYLDDCASIVFKSPRKTRFNIDWPEESIELVQQQIDKVEFLQGYSYQD